MRKWLSVADIEKLLGKEPTQRLVEGVSAKKRQHVYKVEVIKEDHTMYHVQARSEKEARQIAEQQVLAGTDKVEDAYAGMRSRIIKERKPKAEALEVKTAHILPVEPPPSPARKKRVPRESRD